MARTRATTDAEADSTPAPTEPIKLGPPTADVISPLRPATGGNIAKPKGLTAKLAEVMGELRNIPKLGHNRTQNYDYVRESDVSEAASKLLAERGIWVEQSVLSAKTKPLYETQSGMTMWVTRVWVEYYFRDGETDETTPPRKFPGDGADTGDKSLPKALTNAGKYFLMKSFLISTGDDPEADEKVDKAAAAAAAGSTGVRVARGRQTGVQRGGKSEFATTAQISEIAKLARNAGLTAESVVPAIEKITGTSMPDDQTIRDWLGTMTAVQAAVIIVALSTPEGSEVVPSTEPSTPVDDPTEPTPITIV